MREKGEDHMTAPLGWEMKKLRGRWSPSREQISLAIDCAAARMPISKAAELLGIKPRSLWIFTRRVNLPGLFGAWKDRPRYVPVSRVSGGAGTGKSAAAPPSQRGHPMTAPHCRLTAHGASLAANTALRKPWRSWLYLNGKDLHLGYYASKAEALEAHADAVREHLGEEYLVDRKPIPGVSRAAWSKRPGWQAWRACPRVEGRRVHLGYYPSQAEAAAAVEAT